MALYHSTCAGASAWVCRRGPLSGLILPPDAAVGKQLWRTPVHEAGHAVIGRVLDLDCGSATIVADWENLEAGHAITLDPWVTVTRWDHHGLQRGIEAAVRGRIIMLMAGRLAEVVILGRADGADDEDQ